jgi:hypothetical protein
MEKNLKDICIYRIWEDKELQDILDKINNNSISEEETGDLLRQVLHWRSQYRYENELLKRNMKIRDLYKNRLDALNKE